MQHKFRRYIQLKHEFYKSLYSMPKISRIIILEYIYSNYLTIKKKQNKQHPKMENIRYKILNERNILNLYCYQLWTETDLLINQDININK